MTTSNTARLMRSGLACAVAYLVLTLPFEMAQVSNAYALIRPLDGIGPALGLVLGWPAIAGCALGWTAGRALVGVDAAGLAASIAVELIYLALPYLIWHATRRIAGRLSKGDPIGATPRLDTLGRVGLYVGAAAIDSLFAGSSFEAVGLAGPAGAGLGEVCFYHSFVYLTYLGLPCVLLLSRRRAGGGRMALGELMVALFLGVTAALSVVFFAITYGVYVLDGTFSTFEDYMALVRTFYVINTQITPAGLIIMMLSVRAVSRRATRPVEALTASTSAFVGMLEEQRDRLRARLEVSQVDESGMAPAAEVRELVDAVNAMERDLVTYVAELAHVTAERERVEAELDIARDIQAGAIPHDFSAQAARGLAIDGFMRPAREVGGDFYDVFDLDADRTALVVGDVSGKGVPAPLFMMRAVGLLRSCITSEPNLGRALTAANNGLSERNDAMLFVTAFVCVLDRSRATLSFANAGHNPPSIARAGGRSYLRVRPGLVLGALEGVTYASGCVPFSPGSGIVLYTDGVTEAANASGELLGEERLACVLGELDADCVPVESAATGTPIDAAALDAPAAVAERVVAAVDAFAGEEPQADDITLLSLVWKLPGERLELLSEDAELPRLLAFVEARVAALALDPDEAHGLAFDLKLVAEELFINTCRHGHLDGPALATATTLRVDAAARRLYLVYEDTGTAYDPLSHETVMPTAEGPVGGLGVHLVRKLTDHASYAREDERNVLTLTRRI